MTERKASSLEESRLPLRLMLENIRSAENVGALFRLADVFGLEGLDLAGFTPTPPRPDLAKVALGAEKTVPWAAISDLPSYLKDMKTKGYRILALEQVHGSQSLSSWLPNGKPTLLILGHEVDGVSEETLIHCDGALEIPQFGSKHSLNVATAAAVAAWEYSRQARS
jgi:23S rRNA (guanosine2251-2'-O)-methyltransferase